MIDGTTVKEHEHGLVRVFNIEDTLSADLKGANTYDAFAQVLQVDSLNEADIQRVDTDALGDMSLSDFLRTAYDVRAEDIADHAEALNAVSTTGSTVLIVRSGAFTNRPVDLFTTGYATLIATLREPDSSVTFDDLPNPNPQAVLEDAPQAKKPSDAAMSGRVATLALIVMAVLVILMIWIAS